MLPIWSPRCQLLYVTNCTMQNLTTKTSVYKRTADNYYLHCKQFTFVQWCGCRRPTSAIILLLNSADTTSVTRLLLTLKGVWHFSATHTATNQIFIVSRSHYPACLKHSMYGCQEGGGASLYNFLIGALQRRSDMIMCVFWFHQLFCVSYGTLRLLIAPKGTTVSSTGFCYLFLQIN